MSSVSIAREERYNDIAKNYDEKELEEISVMFAKLIMALEAEQRPADVLGKVFHFCEFHNKYKGQFFTPQRIGDFMAQTTSGKDIILKDKGYIKVCEPTCGSGVLVLAMANALDKAGFNHTDNLLVHATDLDLKCVHMCYLQLSLWGIPAIVFHGNTLTLEINSV